MVNGVVSLRCPACARPFISLQQQPGTLITCPHCARSSAWETYPLAGEGGTQGVTALPIQRRIVPMRGGLAPFVVQAPAQSVFRQHQPPQTAASAPSALAWPPAPEQLPMFTPSSPLFPPAPAAGPIWPPGTVPPSSPFGVAPAVQPPLFQPQSPDPLQAFSPSSSEDSASPFQEPVAVNALPAWQPPSEQRNVPLGIFFVLVLAFVSWMLWENSRSPMVAELDAPLNPPLQPVVKPKTDPSPVESALPTTESPPDPVPEIRRAELPFTPGAAAALKKKPDLLVASEAAEHLLKSLFSAESASKRAEMIFQPEDNRADMNGFFERNRITLKRCKLADTLPILLPGKETVPLFEVVTDKNRNGAWGRLVPQEKGFLLDWPLFAETHERRLAEYQKKKPDQPVWFHVVLRRSHALELAEAVRTQHVCIELQASVDDSARCLALVPEETPLGRFFEREVDWGNVYLARLLLQKRKLNDGTEGMVILDCEGAAITNGIPGIR